MAKPLQRTYSRLTTRALTLLGQQVRLGRKERRITAQELADRAGISRSLVQRIEKGEPGCQIGAVFEAAILVGIPLFNADEVALSARSADAQARLALLPKHTRHRRKPVDDEF